MQVSQNVVRKLHSDPTFKPDKDSVVVQLMGQIRTMEDSISSVLVALEYGPDMGTIYRLNQIKGTYETTVKPLANLEGVDNPEESQATLEGIDDPEGSTVNLEGLDDPKESLANLEGVRQAGQGETEARKTGSLARGEMGAGGAKEQEGDGGHIFTPSQDDLDAGEFRVEYLMVDDTYFLSSGAANLKGWKLGAFQTENLALKIEHDHNMMYLARTDDGSNAPGSITWKFRAPEGYVTGTVKLIVNSTVFKTGLVVWQLCGETTCLLPQPGTLLDTDQLIGCSELKLTANLSKGVGNVAWQHTQLFRCEIPRNTGIWREITAPSLGLVIALKKK